MALKLNSAIIRKFIPGRKTDSRKGQNGKVLVVGGSYMYHGAPILASLAALRAGTDLVYTAVPKINASATRAISPNLIVIPMVDAKLTRGS
ncbi:MAG: NAD(P)H-hydrate dehydratase, partial [Candidatus Nitrosotenuis sp.]